LKFSNLPKQKEKYPNGVPEQNGKNHRHGS
jgi:hypothetical protein